MSGQAKYVQLWECYYKECQAVVFVVGPGLLLLATSFDALWSLVS
jgi:hypothetical protein